MYKRYDMSLKSTDIGGRDVEEGGSDGATVIKQQTDHDTTRDNKAGNVDTGSDAADAYTGSDVANRVRRARYVDVGDDSDMFKSKSLNDLKSFYNGDILTKRMGNIRESIYYIRQHWGEFDSFLDSVNKFILKNEDLEFNNETAKRDIKVLLTLKRDWLKEDEVTTKAITYEAIKTYTSVEGYRIIYGLSNRIFRQEDSIAIQEQIRHVVFLVELINIDLFNYCTVYPERANFEGIVYRGQLMKEEDLDLYRKLSREPLNKRHIAVPLGLVSSSASRDVAEKFIIDQVHDKKPEDEMFPLLMRIHVIGLKLEYTRHYARSFPSSVVSTICAVDIRNLSVFPDECEVLLRGPFFVVLDMYKDPVGMKGEPCEVLECVMLNANRDHISTSFLGDQDGKAREMFGTMVNVTRSQFALRFCRERGLDADANEYKKLLKENTAKLDRLMNE